MLPGSSGSSIFKKPAGAQEPPVGEEGRGVEGAVIPYPVPSLAPGSGSQPSANFSHPLKPRSQRLRENGPWSLQHPCLNLFSGIFYSWRTRAPTALPQPRLHQPHPPIKTPGSSLPQGLCTLFTCSECSLVLSPSLARSLPWLSAQVSPL